MNWHASKGAAQSADAAGVTGTVAIQDVGGKTAPDLNCWPSPTTGILNVAFEADGPVDYRIIGADGSLAVQGQWPGQVGQAQQTVGHLASGTYILQVVSGTAIATRRFVVD